MLSKKTLKYKGYQNFGYIWEDYNEMVLYGVKLFGNKICITKHKLGQWPYCYEHKPHWYPESYNLTSNIALEYLKYFFKSPELFEFSASGGS